MLGWSWVGFSNTIITNTNTTDGLQIQLQIQAPSSKYKTSKIQIQTYQVSLVLAASSLLMQHILANANAKLQIQKT